MKTRLFLLSLLLNLTLLVGCTSMNEDFDCPAGKGIGCQSVTEVKKKLNQGDIDLPETTTEAYQRRGGNTSIMLPVLSNTSVQGITTPVSFVDSNGMVIRRTPEKPLRIWIAPYQDPEGNLREASVIHTVVQSGTWHMSSSSQ